MTSRLSDAQIIQFAEASKINSCQLSNNRISYAVPRSKTQHVNGDNFKKPGSGFRAKSTKIELDDVDSEPSSSVTENEEDCFSFSEDFFSFSEDEENESQRK